MERQSSKQIQDSLKQRVVLYMSCRKLKDLDVMSKSDPQVEVYLKDKTSQNWSLIGKTEIIKDNLNPDFITSVECDYFFEREQHVKFVVNDIDNAKGDKDFIGQCETTIGKIFGSKCQTFMSELVLAADNHTSASKKSRG